MRAGLDGPMVRFARHGELAAIDALLGGTDWTARNALGVLVTANANSGLLGGAVLRLCQTSPSAAGMRMTFRFVDGSDASRALSSLIEFATAACVRAGGSSLIVDRVPAGSSLGQQLEEHRFRNVATAFRFQGNVADALATADSAARKAATRSPEFALVPLASCNANEVISLAASGIGALGFGVRALGSGDFATLSEISASYGIIARNRLLGAIVGSTATDPAFIEMLVVDRKLSRSGLAAMLIERCAETLWNAGIGSYWFTTAQSNRSMLRLAAHLGCKQTERLEVWTIRMPSLNT